MNNESFFSKIKDICPEEWREHVSMELLNAGARCKFSLAGRPIFYTRYSSKINRIEIDPSNISNPEIITSNYSTLGSGLMALNIDIMFSYTDFYELISTIVQTIINDFDGERFGCCSSFIECSDSLKCIREGNLEYMGCYYRKNLRAGKVFYGKNINV